MFNISLTSTRVAQDGQGYSVNIESALLPVELVCMGWDPPSEPYRYIIRLRYINDVPIYN